MVYKQNNINGELGLILNHFFSLFWVLYLVFEQYGGQEKAEKREKCAPSIAQREGEIGLVN